MKMAWMGDLDEEDEEEEGEDKAKMELDDKIARLRYGFSGLCPDLYFRIVRTSLS